MTLYNIVRLQAKMSRDDAKSPGSRQDPPDGGWGWVALPGCVLVIVPQSYFMIGNSVLYLNQLERFSTYSTPTVAAAVSLFNGLHFLCGEHVHIFLKWINIENVKYILQQLHNPKMVLRTGCSCKEPQ